ncbi:hypothetical protein [Streptomyces phytophilus]|uniref:hypothetical protein n=1 Tax=Streptomyces phytophilus TaxID=722715 RepID=UPI0015F07B44|nr:hypothetical protein [Streptomyces phytophilus]
MNRVEDSYLGWELLQHQPNCPRPRWTVDVRTADAYRSDRSYYRDEPGPGHSCPDEDCGHGPGFREIRVRVVCTACGTAHLITGEDTAETGQTTTSTRYLGYGMAPRHMAGLYLYPGQPWLDLGRANTEWPHDFLVTTAKVNRVTRADVAGSITQSRGRRGAVQWAACAVPSEDGQYGFGFAGTDALRWAAASDGMRTVAAAAKWIAAQLDRAAGGDGRG